ncbi:Oidioi.mRNA.OKI2018_I69.XSR.g15732.t1.cds [Oikopleura dioica]|uniref:Oidioi.mRNA.OKI2018_I69.XSR.g15732.t1.cds n=1 Tax=Oikopleura dioica TaxID=34765 RepID=A0ABN7SIV0_OIKDI|nr:Oidioi.mRNA.OKI2018_I69.XSR.g15732.t1.cds [Oikopleura dioica]
MSSEGNPKPLAERNELEKQESKLRSMYGNLEKRKGPGMLMKKLQGGGRQYFDSADYTLQKGAKGNPLMKKNDAAKQVPVHKATFEEGGSPREAAGKTKKRLSNTSSLANMEDC